MTTALCCGPAMTTALCCVSCYCCAGSWICATHVHTHILSLTHTYQYITYAYYTQCIIHVDTFTHMHTHSLSHTHAHAHTHTHNIHTYNASYMWTHALTCPPPHAPSPPTHTIGTLRDTSVHCDTVCCSRALLSPCQTMPSGSSCWLLMDSRPAAGRAGAGAGLGQRQGWAQGKAGLGWIRARRVVGLGRAEQSYAAMTARVDILTSPPPRPLPYPGRTPLHPPTPALARQRKTT